MISILGDKDVKSYFSEIAGVFDQIILTQNSSPRALQVAELEIIAKKYYPAEKISKDEKLSSAIDEAITRANLLNQSSNYVNGVVITGSVFSVGEAKNYLRNRYGKLLSEENYI